MDDHSETIIPHHYSVAGIKTQLSPVFTENRLLNVLFGKKKQTYVHQLF